MAILEWITNIVWAALKLACAWVIIRVVVKHGKTTFKEVLDTVVLRLRVGCARMRKRDIRYLKQEQEDPEEEQPQVVEARIL